MKTCYVRMRVAELSAEKSTTARDLAGELNRLLVQGKLYRMYELKCICVTLHMHLHVVGALLNDDIVKRGKTIHRGETGQMVFFFFKIQ